MPTKNKKAKKDDKKFANSMLDVIYKEGHGTDLLIGSIKYGHEAGYKKGIRVGILIGLSVTVFLVIGVILLAL